MMNMPIKAVIDIFGIVLEIVIISSFFGMFAGPKFKNKWVVTAYAAYLVVASLSCILVASEIFLFLRILLAVFALSFLYDSTLLTRILLSVLIMILLLLSEILTGIATSAIVKLPVPALMSNPLYYLQCVVISKMLLVILIKASGHYLKPRNVQISKPIIVILLMLPIATFLIILVLSDYAEKLQKEQTIWMVIAILGLVVSNISLIYLFEWQLRKEAKHKKESIERKQIELQIDYYKEALAKRKEHNKAMHDFKNQLFAISDMVSKNNPEGVEKIRELCDFVVSASQINYTQNDALNALLQSKKRAIDDNSIEFTCKSLMLEHNEISDLDLCIVIGNLLDNSIEACMRIDEGEKNIKLLLKQQDDYLIVEMKNSFNAKLGADIRFTSKEDKILHGFGLKSVNEIAEAHMGALTVTTEESEFTATVMLKNSK